MNDNPHDPRQRLPKEIVELQDNVKQLQALLPVRKSFADIVVEAFNREHLRLRIADRNLVATSEQRQEDKVLTWLFGRYVSGNFFTFFTDASMKELTEELTKNVILRNFVLNLVERVSSEIETQGADERDKFIDEVVRGIKHSKGDKEISLLPNALTMSIELDSESKLKTLFKNNIFLHVLYVLVMYFDRTAIYPDLANPKQPAPAQQARSNTQRQQ